MANNAIQLFNYYRRYKWRAADFDTLQLALSDQARGIAEGAYGGAVLLGGDVDPAATGLQVNVSAAVAVGPTGYLHVQSGVSVSLSAPTGSNPSLSLVVLRPELTPNSLITKPTSPFETVPLRVQQGSQVVVVPGTPAANPAYPVKGANDVVLCGVRLAPGQVNIAETDLDYTVRDEVGRNSEHGQNTFAFDDRCRPFRATATTVGIKPSQTRRPMRLLDTGKGQPSIFPKTAGGLFQAVDTVLNFVTGAITGGDEVSPDFTPVIPSGSNSVVATVVLNARDELQVQYGTPGTLAQCLAGIANQTRTGAGSIALARGRYKIAYVVVTSRSGALSDLLVVDARSLGGGGSGAIVEETAISNNVSNVAVPGFLLDALETKAFVAQIALVRRHSGPNSEAVFQGVLRGVYSPAGGVWELSGLDGFGDDTGVDFDMTAGGQLRYTSTNIAGTVVESLMRWTLQPL